ncbi:hypothetical protein BA893_11730 [Vibrio natriegens]|uniref:DUF2066 domain-containing protein n=1 Tax=Vibrio natriegens TaxID=691 RepID=UPI00080416FC|nr:DUF2066 domain-containing protein [Vibrio natriegens]ANQ22309.1 hypothetical protein BA893_11730 [Vibrio natriegens]
MRYLALLLIGWLSLPVYALTQVDIYRAEVVIDSEQDNGESLAREQGMKEVIVRATGSQSSLSNTVIQKALSSSSRYISQLGYGQVDGKPSLDMRFNSGQIHSLLTQAQLPSWSPHRANILVWAIEEQAYERTIAWENSDSAQVSALRVAAETRGLPITVPVGDFDDVTGVDVSDLWGGFVEPIAKASQRYPVDAVMVLKAQGDQIRWTLYDQSPSAILVSQRSPRSGSATGVNAMAEVVDAISDYYAGKSAVVVSGESSDGITMKVVNIDSAKDFFHLESALKKLNSVAGTEVKRVQGNELTLKLHLLASKEAFEKEASSISQLGDYQEPVTPVEAAAPLQPVQEPIQPELATQEESLASDVVTADVAVEEVKESEPVVVQPAQEQYDVIYEWTSSQRS